MSPVERQRSWPSRFHLIAAALQGNKELLDLVLRAGVNPNEVDSQGETVLHDLAQSPESLAAIAMLLPYMSELGIRNNAGLSPADVALSRGYEHIATIITEAQGVAHPWWRLPRVSDAARFLTFGPVNSSDNAWLVKKLDAEDMWCKVPAEVRALRIARLPFYQDGHLLAIEHTDRRGPREQFALVQPNRQFVVLNWTNQPFYIANERWPVIFTEETVPAYIRTFFHFVRSQQGQFQIVDDVAEINWLDSATADERRAVESRLKPLEVESFVAGDRAVFSSTVVFRNSLFQSKILISFRDQARIDPDDEDETMPIGGLKLFEESLLLEDLPVYIPLPPATWG
jgi:hypothetical protein